MIRILKGIVWIGVILGIIGYINYSSFISKTLPENKVIQIHSGDLLGPALHRELGVSEWYLKIYLKLHPEIKVDLQAGEYRFLQGENITSILKTINYGSMNVDEKMTFLEGWNIFDIDEYLTNKNFIESGEFISEANSVSKYNEQFPFLKNARTLEGYLYPDTYFVSKHNFSLDKVITMMLENFQIKIYTPFLSQLHPNQINEVITMASIVEKEERNKNEKPTVAGILLKRYKEHWMIGADITACYAYELTSEACKLNLSKYIGEKNEYNTRTMTGLPKTPINNPSLESIRATINPKASPYYYYLHDKNGNVYYARTNEEHVANKKYMK